jgi:hypothetical protein
MFRPKRQELREGRRKLYESCFILLSVSDIVWGNYVKENRLLEHAASMAEIKEHITF